MPRHHDTVLPRDAADEKNVLTGFLGHLRGAVAAKADGVGDPAAREPGVPSGTSLLGLVSHLTHVERHYFLGEAVRDWPATFRPRDEDTAEDVVAAYREATARGTEVGPVAALAARAHDRGDRTPRRACRHPPRAHRRPYRALRPRSTGGRAPASLHRGGR